MRDPLMLGPPRITGFLFVTQLDDAMVRRGSIVLGWLSSSVDCDFVIHNVQLTSPFILMVLS